jgi:hypothetical protein
MVSDTPARAVLVITAYVIIDADDENSHSG